MTKWQAITIFCNQLFKYKIGNPIKTAKAL